MEHAIGSVRWLALSLPAVAPTSMVLLRQVLVRRTPKYLEDLPRTPPHKQSFLRQVEYSKTPVSVASPSLTETTLRVICWGLGRCISDSAGAPGAAASESSRDSPRIRRPGRAESGCWLRCGWSPLARKTAFAGEAPGMPCAGSDRSRGEEARRRCRSVLCQQCHDAVTTPIPVGPAISTLTAFSVRSDSSAWVPVDCRF
jgi:hypothetical protein